MPERTPSILFSHAYKKLLVDGRPIRTATLLLVLYVQMEELTQAKQFIEYDTDNGVYKIPFDTYYLLLVFQKSNGDLFTTVRPASRNKMAFGFNAKYKSKFDYYRGLVGQEFNILINQADL